MNDNADLSLDDPRVVAALEEYQEALEAGRRPNRELFLARHAEIADALAECLDGLEALHGSVPAREPNPVPESLGEPLGDFRLVREIGRGGMGVVYEAEQMSLGRRVALKVLPFAAALDARQLQRFKNEAQAAAHLHHSHIVPVYGVGAERGVHYYAMQLIEGQNLAALVQEVRHGMGPKDSSSAVRLAGDQTTGPYPVPAPGTADTRTQLGAQLTSLRTSKAQSFFRAIARLTAQAAEALDYAHGVGVVHRDIKPANLLVDGRGELWITDFGLAQFQADGGLTQTGDLLGTLRYMSPEQAGGQRVLIDHRTDVYSLGATLYELLTLRPIFDGADRQSLLNQILHEEPKPPRMADRTIPEELETIVLKATAKAPADRYATAGDLAADLHRYLRHEPIQARRPTLTQRARKWLRRHPAVPVAGFVLLVLMTAGSLASAWFISIEQEKTRLANEREQERARSANERERQLALEAVDKMIRVSEEELADRPGMEGLRRRLLESALDYFQQFIAQRQDDPAARADLDATKVRVNKIFDDLAVLQGAGKMFILGDPAVREELALNEQQLKRLDEMRQRPREQMMASFRDFPVLSPEERRQRFLKLAKDKDTEINSILEPEQRLRLAQIFRQVQGLSAFQDPDVIATLKLTAEQKDRIRLAELESPREFFPPPPPRPAGGGDGPRPDRPPPGGGDGTKPEPRRFDPMLVVSEKVLPLLTEEQVRQWKELTGDPIQFQLRFFGGFGPPRKHGPGDR